MKMNAPMQLNTKLPVVHVVFTNKNLITQLFKLYFRVTNPTGFTVIIMMINNQQKNHTSNVNTTLYSTVVLYR